MPIFYFIDPAISSNKSTFKRNSFNGNLTKEQRFNAIKCYLFDDTLQKPKNMITKNYHNVYDVFTAKERYVEEVLGLTRNPTETFDDLLLDDIDHYENYTMKYNFREKEYKIKKYPIIESVYLVIISDTNKISVFSTKFYAEKYRNELDKQRIASIMLKKEVRSY